MAANIDDAQPGRGIAVPLRIQQAFRELRTQGRSLDELLEELDQALALAGGEADEVRAALAREAAQYTLPDDVLEEISKRIAIAASTCNSPQSPAALTPTNSAAAIDATADSEEKGETGEDSVKSEERLVPGTNSRGESNGQKTVLNERYILIECVGVGGSSTVFKALDRRRLLFDDPCPYVAVKILNEKLRTRPDWLDVLKQEASKCHQLRHPNIIRVYDFLRDGERVYITMEFLSGSPLTQVVRAKGFKGMGHKDAMHIIASMASALAFAHERGIVHRDFKPANIFRTEDGNVKLIDFGIAQIFGPSIHGDRKVSPPTAAAGPRHAVTPAYASPELLERREPDPRDDVYSLACTAYELLTGTHPFGYKSAVEARAAGLDVDQRTGITRTQLAAVRRALAFDRQQRTPSVEQFLKELSAEPAAGVIDFRMVSGALLVAACAWWYFYTTDTSMQREVLTEELPESRLLPLAKPNAGGLNDKSLAESVAASRPDDLVPATILPRAPSSKGEPSAPPAAPASILSTDDLTHQSEESQAPAARATTSPAVTFTAAAPKPVIEEATTPSEAAVASGGLRKRDARDSSRLQDDKVSRQQTEEKLVILASAAERQMKRNRLVLPPGNNARDSYLKMLALDKNNLPAQRGLRQLAERLYNDALSKKRQGDVQGSLELVRQGLSVNKSHVPLLSLMDDLIQHTKIAKSGSTATSATTLQIGAVTKPTDEKGMRTAEVPSKSPSPAVTVEPTVKPRVRIFGGF